MLAAVSVAALGLAVLTSFVIASGIVTKPVAPNPFGMTLQETAPATTGIGGIVLMMQAEFFAAVTATLQAMKVDRLAFGSLIGIGFLYGILHAAGPGHGKAVISAYLLSTNQSVRRGVLLSLAAALLQAIMAVGLVSILVFLVDATASSINSAARGIELVSFAAIAAIGAILLWRKAGELVEALAPRENVGSVTRLDDDASFFARAGRSGVGQLISIVVAAGIRPCSGAILLLVFAESQGLFLAGIAGAFAMAVGTAVTTSSLATLSIATKTFIRRMAPSHNVGAGVFAGGVELLAAAFVFSFGLLLLSSMWAGCLPGALD